MPTIHTARSFLFAPGGDERKLRKALTSGADAVVADLEDAVAAVAKAGARRVVTSVLADAEGEALRLVRVNGAGSEWVAHDVEAVAALDVDAVVLPKAEPESLSVVAGLGIPVVAIVETPRGLRHAYEIAETPFVTALVLGAVDLGLALRLERREDSQEILFARSSLVVDSAAAGIRAPVDQVWTTLGDPDGLRRDCLLARSLGLRGKACIHPEQVAIVNDAFAPTEDDLARAHGLIRAYEAAAAQGQGTIRYEGEMVDLPVVERARELVADAKRSVLHGE